MKHFQGNCHIYVDCAADLDMAERIIVNAKCQRPGVCNAAESLLVHQEIARSFVPRLAAALTEQAWKFAAAAARGRWERVNRRPMRTTPPNISTLIVSLKNRVIHWTRPSTISADLAHSIPRPSSLTTGKRRRRFTAAVDASAVLVNASTRFNDGFRIGTGSGNWHKYR